MVIFDYNLNSDISFGDLEASYSDGHRGERQCECARRRSDDCGDTSSVILGLFIICAVAIIPGAVMAISAAINVINCVSAVTINNVLTINAPAYIRINGWRTSNA